jgi:glycolate oxidase FAD binding subunit
VQDAVRAAASTRTPVRVVGRGSWLDAGHPTASEARPLSLSALAGIVAYAPGDLTMTVRAGTSLATIAAATLEHRQWLALDPFATDLEGGSIGATVATASSGPLAGSLGQTRDIVLGLEIVTGDGTVIRSGGRVVKNVAGFDITRLMTGAWGTLGVITEVTVRLRGIPAVDETVAVVERRAAFTRAPARTDAQIVDALASGLRRSVVEPIAAEIVDSHLAAQLSVPSAGGPVLLVRLSGNAERVAAERDALGALGDTAPVPMSVWPGLRRIEPPMGANVAVVRWGHLPSNLARTWAHVASRCEGIDGALIHASVSRGLVRAIVPGGDAGRLAAGVGLDLGRTAAERVHGGDVSSMGPAAADMRDGSVAPERLPAALWRMAAAHGTDQPRVSTLSRRVRSAFDPDEILNRGIMGNAGPHG